MQNLYFDDKKLKFYIIENGDRLYLSNCFRVTGSYDNGDNKLFGGIVYFSKTIKDCWYILNDIGNDFIPLYKVKSLEVL